MQSAKWMTYLLVLSDMFTHKQSIINYRKSMILFLCRQIALDENLATAHNHTPVTGIVCPEISPQ